MKTQLITWVALTLVMLTNGAIFGQSIAWQSNLELASAKAASENKLVLLHFTADWCRPCKSLDTFVFSNLHVIRSMAANVVPVRIDVDQRPELAKEYAVSAVPFDVIITPAGRVVVKRSSPRDSSAYASMIDGLSKTINALAAGNPTLNQNLDDLKDQIYSDNQIVEQKSFTPTAPSHTAPAAANDAADLKRRSKIVNPYAHASPQNRTPVTTTNPAAAIAKAEAAVSTLTTQAELANAAPPAAPKAVQNQFLAPLEIPIATPVALPMAATVDERAQAVATHPSLNSQLASNPPASNPPASNPLSDNPLSDNPLSDNPPATGNRLDPDREVAAVTMETTEPAGRYAESIAAHVDAAMEQVPNRSTVWDQPNVEVVQPASADNPNQFLAQAAFAKPQPALGELKTLLEKSTSDANVGVMQVSEGSANAKLVLPVPEVKQADSTAGPLSNLAAEVESNASLPAQQSDDHSFGIPNSFDFGESGLVSERQRATDSKIAKPELTAAQQLKMAEMVKSVDAQPAALLDATATISRVSPSQVAVAQAEQAGGGRVDASTSQPTAPVAAGAETSPRLPENVALKGKCPVSLLKIGAWVDGDPRFGCVHRDRVYLFASEANLREFQQDPDGYSPLLAGFDPVVFHNEGELVDGKEEHGVFMGKAPRQRVVLFSSPETCAEFQANPRTYINAIRQAMQSSGGSSSNLLR